MPPRRKAVKPAERNRDDFLWSIDAFLDRTFDLPDIIEFALSDAYLGRNLYPAQGTMLKIWALQDELFTQFDYDLIGEWTDSFSQTRDNGTQPDILERIKICKAEGRPWFREWINILGRRGAKGYVGAMAGSYVLWHYIAMGDPHAYFGLDRDKPLAMLVFAGKKDQAITNQWGDLNNVITGAPCFVPYLPQRTLMKEALYVYAPHDFIRIQDRQDMGVMVNVDTMASFQILPKESTLLSARGPAVFCEMFDEMAHITRETANVSADELWTQATPALDTFHEKAFIYEGSSPWQMIGQFYENAQQAVAISDGLDGFPQGTILRPEIFLLQLESWRPYEAWDRSHEIPLRPEGKEKPHATVFPKQRQAVQEYDDQMRRLEAANPETFSVERRCLDPETRVLGTDLRWYPIKDLRVGQQLITLDEEGETAGFDAHPTRKKRERKLRVGVVEAMNQVIDRAYRIGFEDGTSVICSGRHRWLASTKGSPNYQRWASIESCSARGPRSVLKVGDAIRGVVEPWEELDGEEALKAAYLAGAYDGEGSICNRNRLRTEFRIDFTQNPGTVLDTVLDLLHDLKFNPRSSGSKKKAQQYKITGLGEGLRFLGQIRPLRLLENAAPSSRNSGFWEGRALGHENGKRLCKVIVQIDELPEQELIDIQTSTGTFVAEGLVSHNSKWAAVLDAYLNPGRVDAMFNPWPEAFPVNLGAASEGKMILTYYAHADPSKVGKNTSLVVCHKVEIPGDPMPHVIVDYVTHWEPSQFTENNFEIDYRKVREEMAEVIRRFMPSEFTFDQGYSAEMIQELKRFVNGARLPKPVNVFQRTTTFQSNWAVAETFKYALGLGLVHCYPDTRSTDLLRNECKFLQLVADRKVDHPTAGPVQTSDIYDSLSILVHLLIGRHIAAMVGQDMMQVGIQGSQPGGFAQATVYGEQRKAPVGEVAAKMMAIHRPPMVIPVARGGRFQGRPGRLPHR